MDRSRHRRRSRRTLRYFFTSAMSVVLITTQLFGTAPENELSTTFQQTLGEYFPEELLNPMNEYLELLAAPTIPVAGQEVIETVDVVEAEDVAFALAEIGRASCRERV